ncbi:MAG: carbohydrate kinase [Holophagales bacterium]|nr:carbohydrate kinase [Holophagales bacterium]MXX61168.1 carbohydrate kinase [Holophagales bacterium]MYC11666.1 carbohydrate kinase [Holophagales bacterium]MYD22134.1 carbohydrate kinase [Holophagales bacterium]MYI32803.1 carbohydrate kinase [Holophagales bacterium]
MNSAFYLGIDVGTQSLTAILVEAPRSEGDGEDRAEGIASRVGVHYDTELPRYGTVNGQLPNEDPAIGRAPPCMWLEALDLAFRKLGSGACREISGVSVSGQQHGSVYLRPGAEALQSLTPKQSLAEQIEPILARPEAPIWTDSSTTRECEEIRRELGGPHTVAELTGSDTFERFTGPQIRRFARTEPEAWARTAHVCLVSSFVTSVLAGRLAAIDHGDGSGMNLLDVRRLKWSEAAMAATATGLRRRLPPTCAPWTVVGPIAPYFVSRYGLPASAKVVAGSGDNPCSLVGVGVREPGEAVLSLGTSDTYFGLLKDVAVDPEANGHVFIAPSGHPMSLICFRNGSLAREAVRDRYGLDWPGFDAALRATPAGNDGMMMLPWFEPEIVPRVARPHVHRLGGLRDEPEQAARNCRAVVEGQFLSMRLNSRWMATQPRRLVATGGGSRNRELLQIAADVLDCRVESLEVTDGAALGAALRATGQRLPPLPPVGERGPAAEPRPEASAIYDAMMPRYAEAQRRAAG